AQVVGVRSWADANRPAAGQHSFDPDRCPHCRLWRELDGDELRSPAAAAPGIANPHFPPPPVERRHAQAGALAKRPHALAADLLLPKLLAPELLTTAGRRSLASRHADALRNGEKHQHN